MYESWKKMEQDTGLFLHDSSVVMQDTWKVLGSIWHNLCYI